MPTFFGLRAMMLNTPGWPSCGTAWRSFRPFGRYSFRTPATTVSSASSLGIVPGARFMTSWPAESLTSSLASGPLSLASSLPVTRSFADWYLSFTHCLPFWYFPLAQLRPAPKSFLAPLTAPITTKSTALPIGAWTFWMIEWIFSEMPPRPSRLARKEIASGSALARLLLDLLGDRRRRRPWRSAPIESRIESTNSMICAPRSMKNMMTS